MAAVARSKRTGRVRAVPWRQDEKIRARLRMVERVYWEPMSRALDIVNRQLVSNGEPPITDRQLYHDKAHLKELFQEQQQDLAHALDRHMVNFEVLKSMVARSALSTPDGPARAPLYAILTRIEEDQAKLDGSWGAVRDVGPATVDESSFGPAPQELLERGQISVDEYKAFLVVMQKNVGGRSTRERGALPPTKEDSVIEGVAAESERPGRPPNPTGPIVKSQQANRGRPGEVPPGMPRPGEDERVVKWNPDDDEFEATG